MADESRVGKVSFRGILALFLVFTLCWLCGRGMEIPEALNSAVSMALGFYFGQKTANGGG